MGRTLNNDANNFISQDAAYQVKADGTNEFVFNTEAHPVRIPGTASSSKRRT